MRDYKDRFAVEFKNATEELGLAHSQALRARLLGFIEGECTEVGSRALYEGQKLGRAAEREELAAHVEGMYGEPAKRLNTFKEGYKSGYNTALDDLLAHLRQSDEKLVGYNCDVCHGTKFSGDDVVLHLCEGVAKPVYEPHTPIYILDCMCKEPWTEGVIHSKTSPCYLEPRQSDAPQGCCEKCSTSSLGFNLPQCFFKDCPCHKKAPQGDNKE